MLPRCDTVLLFSESNYTFSGYFDPDRTMIVCFKVQFFNAQMIQRVQIVLFVVMMGRLWRGKLLTVGLDQLSSKLETLLPSPKLN